MRIIKKIGILSLSAFLVFNPLTIKAENLKTKNEMMKLEETSENEVSKLEEGRDYLKFSGKITRVNSKEEHLSILVENDMEEGLNSIILHISDDVVLLKDMTKDFVDKSILKEGMEISTYYYKHTPMLLSMPPQMTPDVIVINESQDYVGIKVSQFDENLVSADNMLKITSLKDTLIVDTKGNELSEEDIANKDLIVFYTWSTKSIPAQTNPDKIIIMEKKEKEVKLELLDKLILNGKEMALDHELYVNNEGTIMVPLRQIAEALDYKVIWDNETRSAELTKGVQWTKVTIGEDNYNFARMLVHLGTAPELKDSKTYVPMNFLEEILKYNVEITTDGIMEIK